MNFNMSKITAFLQNTVLKIKNVIKTVRTILQNVILEMKNIDWSSRSSLLKYLLQFIIIAVISMIVLFILDQIIIKALKLIF